MGYTRYWRVKKLDEKKFKHFAYLCKLVVESMNIPVEGCILTEREVRFNGVGDDAHEPFHINQGTIGFNFCKTNGKPYDDLVCACLEFATNIFKDDIAVSSDGENNDPEVRLEVKRILRERKINILLDES